MRTGISITLKPALLVFVLLNTKLLLLTMLGALLATQAARCLIAAAQS